MHCVKENKQTWLAIVVYSKTILKPLCSLLFSVQWEDLLLLSFTLIHQTG